MIVATRVEINHILMYVRCCNCGHTCFKGTLAAMTVKASGLAEVNDAGGFASSSKKDSTKKRKANEPPHQVC